MGRNIHGRCPRLCVVMGFLPILVCFFTGGFPGGWGASIALFFPPNAKMYDTFIPSPFSLDGLYLWGLSHVTYFTNYCLFQYSYDCSVSAFVPTFQSRVCCIINAFCRVRVVLGGSGYVSATSRYVRYFRWFSSVIRIWAYNEFVGSRRHQIDFLLTRMMYRFRALIFAPQRNEKKLSWFSVSRACVL